MDIAISIIATLILVIVNGYFSMSEMALVNAKRAVLEKEARDGDEGAKKAIALTQDSDDFLATIQVAITLVGFFASAAAATNLSGPLTSLMHSANLSPLTAVAPYLSPVLITLVVSYLSIVVGELVPKRMALANAESIAKSVSAPLLVFQKIIHPLVVFTSASSNGLSKILGIKSSENRHSVSEDEIKYLVTDNDELQDDEKRMINEIIELGDTTVREVMQPRIDIVVSEYRDSVSAVIEKMEETGYSRIPIYKENYEHIAGIVYYKDLVRPLLDGKGESNVGNYVYDAIFVPESRQIYPLLSQMQAQGAQLAVVIDEHGGMVGIITLEDILEEIVGEITDEKDNEAALCMEVSPECWVAQGKMDIDMALEHGWPIEESEVYDTIAGWFLEKRNAMPKVGDSITQDGFAFTVKAMRRQRIAYMTIERMSKAENDEKDTDIIV